MEKITMTKAIIISTIALLFLSCSEDGIKKTVPAKTTCECEKYAFNQISTTNPINGQSTIGPKNYLGGIYFYSNSCKDNGRTWYVTSSTNGNSTLHTGWEVKCK